MEGKGNPHTWSYSTGRGRAINEELSLEKTLKPVGTETSHILFPSVIQVGMWHTRDLFLLGDLRASRYLRQQAGHENELCTAGIAESLA